MIYEEHGLTDVIAFNGAMKKAGIEVILQTANPEVTTDVICAVDTTKHDSEIRADERARTIEELRSFIDKNYENIVFELKSGGKIEDANRVIDKFMEQMNG